VAHGPANRVSWKFEAFWSSDDAATFGRPSQSSLLQLGVLNVPFSLFPPPPPFETLLFEHLGNPGLFVFLLLPLFFDDDHDDGDDDDSNKTTDQE